MEFIIKKEDFLRCLQKAQGVVEKRNIMPILENALIEAKAESMNFTATDLEVGIHGSCRAEVIKEGKVTLLVKKVQEIVRELPEDRVLLRLKESEQGGRWVEILSGKAVFNIASMDYEDYPALPKYEDAELFEIDSEIMLEMIRKTIFAASIEDSAYNVNGIFFKKGMDKIRMVATDGRRLSVIEKDNIGNKDLVLEEGIIFPKKGLNELKRILEDNKEGKKTLIGFKGNNGIFRIDNLLIIMRLIEGKFPDYNILIPKDNNNRFKIDRRKILGSFKRVSLLSEERVKMIKFAISPGKIVLTASTPDCGEAYDEIKADYNEEEIEIYFNADYFIEALSILESEEVWFEIKDSSSPIIIKPLEENNHTCVIMPMSIE